MKPHRYFNLITFLLITTMIIFPGCEFDVAEPQWKKEHHATATPVINEVIPTQASPGVNTITIRGENLVVQGTNIYFDGYQADIIDSSDTEIVVRRPDYACDTAAIKVVPNRSLIAAKYQPYKIDPVIQEYDDVLIDNQIEMRAPVTDADENLYIVQIAVPRTILKIDTSGNVSEAGVARRSPSDAAYYNGKIYIMANHRIIDVLDLQSGTVSEWLRVPSRAYSGEFSSSGYFVCGGNRSDLMIIAPDSSTVRPGIYNNLNIQAIRVTDEYVYVAAAPVSGNITTTIYRHSFDASGNLGTQDTILALGNTEFASRTFIDFAVAETGLIYIITNDNDPMLVFDPTNQTIDYFYKSIIPFPGWRFNWGGQNFSYLILKDEDNGNFLVYRVDMGSQKE